MGDSQPYKEERWTCPETVLYIEVPICLDHLAGDRSLRYKLQIQVLVDQTRAPLSISSALNEEDMPPSCTALG